MEGCGQMLTLHNQFNFSNSSSNGNNSVSICELKSLQTEIILSGSAADSFRQDFGVCKTDKKFSKMFVLYVIYSI